MCETARTTPNAVFIRRTTDIDHYDNPEVYDPEHFAPDKVKNRDPFAFVPFSAGIRNYIGSRFATLELAVTLAYILRHYRVISMLPEKENRPIPEFSLKPSKGSRFVWKDDENIL